MYLNTFFVVHACSQPDFIIIILIMFQRFSVVSITKWDGVFCPGVGDGPSFALLGIPVYCPLEELPAMLFALENPEVKDNKNFHGEFRKWVATFYP